MLVVQKVKLTRNIWPWCFHFSNKLQGSYEGDPIDISKIFQLDNRAAQTYESKSEPQAFESIPSTYGDEDICNLPKNEGAMCRGSIPSWFYDIESKKCLGFRYRGCHGNKNRFKSKEKCEETCVHNGNYEEKPGINWRVYIEEITFKFSLLDLAPLYIPL